VPCLTTGSKEHQWGTGLHLPIRNTILAHISNVFLSKLGRIAAGMLDKVEWTEERLSNGVLVHLKELPFLVRLFKIVAENGDIEWMITNKEINLKSKGDPPGPISAQDVQDESAVRWQAHSCRVQHALLQIEQMHRELKQLVGTEKCQCRKARAQRNHIACCYRAWLSIKIAAQKMKKTLYQAQADLFRDYLKAQLRDPAIPAYGN